MSNKNKIYNQYEHLTISIRAKNSQNAIEHKNAGCLEEKNHIYQNIELKENNIKCVQNAVVIVVVEMNHHNTRKYLRAKT